MYKTIVKDNVKRLAMDLDKQIRKAIQDNIGKEIKDEDIIKNCLLSEFPDGRKLLSYKGKPIMLFYPQEIKTEYGRNGVHISMTQKYKLVGKTDEI